MIALEEIEMSDVSLPNKNFFLDGMFGLAVADALGVPYESSSFVGITLVLKVVNISGDTDSNAAVAGALAGIIYGKENIPKEWI